jgi:hypothetical protein
MDAAFGSPCQASSNASAICILAVFQRRRQWLCGSQSCLTRKRHADTADEPRRPRLGRAALQIPDQGRPLPARRRCRHGPASHFAEVSPCSAWAPRRRVDGEGRSAGGHALAILPGLTHCNIFSSPPFAAPIFSPRPSSPSSAPSRAEPAPLLAHRLAISYTKFAVVAERVLPVP